MKPLPKALLFAPCGMNCGICFAYLREKNRCQGCRGPDDNKPITRVRCRIKTCEFFKDGNAKFCFQCDDFPCTMLEYLDKRYRKKYGTSIIENLKKIKKLGIVKFKKSETGKWTCSRCGGTVSVHTWRCEVCGSDEKQ